MRLLFLTGVLLLQSAVANACSTTLCLSENYTVTFEDDFTSLSTIAPNGTYSSSYKWFNGVEQCCMSPTNPDPNTGYQTGGVQYPGTYDSMGPVNPYSLNPTGGLNMTMTDQTGAGPFTLLFSGVLTSVASNGSGFSQQYGYFEITAKVSPNVGTWPAFWLLSASKNMEIDIMEQYGHDKNHYWATIHDYTNNITDGPTEYPSTTVDLSTGYHQYGVLWDANNISFYFDRVLMGTFTTPASAKQAMYMLVDQGAGGGWPTTDSVLNGSVYSVQRVKVWKHN